MRVIEELKIMTLFKALPFATLALRQWHARGAFKQALCN